MKEEQSKKTWQKPEIIIISNNQIAGGGTAATLERTVLSVDPKATKSTLILYQS
jgi:hypothetical protein